MKISYDDKNDWYLEDPSETGASWYFDTELVTPEDALGFDTWSTNLLHRIGGPAYEPKVKNHHYGNDYYFLWGVELPKPNYMEAMRFLEENGMVAFVLKYKGSKS